MSSIYEVRYLTTPEQFDEAEQIYQSHDKVMRSAYDRSTEELADKSNSNVHFVGSYYEDSLVAFLKVVVWERMPVYIVGNMNIKKNTLQRYDFTNHKHPIIPIMDFIIKEQESKKRYTWYYNRSLTNAYHKLQLEGKDLLKNCELGWDSVRQKYRYERFIEEVVTAGNLPHHSVHKTFQNKIFDTDYMIVKCCLRNEYRDIPDYFDDIVIEQCLKNTQKTKST
jgi:hypothetical protein